DHPRRLRAGEVVEECRLAVALEDVPQRHDVDLIDRGNRTLCRRIVSTERLDRVADELEADGLGFAGRKDIDDAAADREFALLVSRVFARKAGVNEQVGEIGGGEGLAPPAGEGRRGGGE